MKCNWQESDAGLDPPIAARSTLDAEGRKNGLTDRSGGFSRLETAITSGYKKMGYKTISG